MSLVRMRKKFHGYSKYIMWVMAIVFAVGFAAISIPGGRVPERTDSVLSGVVATVNGEKLDRQAYEMRVRAQIDPIQETRPVSAIEESQIRGQVFDTMVDEMLKLQAAKKEHIKVSRGEVNRQIDQIVEQRLQQIKSSLLSGRRTKQTDEAFEQELRKRDPSMSIKKLRAEIRKSIDPKTVRNYLLMDKLSKKIREKVDTSDRALRQSFEQVKLRQITISASGRSQVQAEQLARDLVAKLRAGGDFAALAKANSQDYYKTAGGDVGWVSKQMLPREVGDVAFKLGEGAVSDPIKTGGEYVIIKVEGRRSSMPADLKDPKKMAEYRRMFVQQEQNKAEYLYYADLRKKAQITINDPELRGYTIAQAVMMSFGQANPAEQKSKIETAIKEYRTAVASAGDRTDIKARCYVQIAQLLTALRNFTSNPEEIKKYKTQTIEALEDALNYTESTDIRLSLGKLYIDAGQPNKAVEHLEIASENAYDDYSMHEQLIELYKKIKRADLVAKEQKWLSENKELAQPQAGQTIPVSGGEIPAGR
ncbi:MAG: peptidylprolyl isomerase [Armatimonadetes bacterium]|nr:peptidylprolyl isomerase [Armatimonadota bacterium]